jgi:nitrous oxidase accessory protein NosD
MVTALYSETSIRETTSGNSLKNTQIVHHHMYNSSASKSAVSLDSTNQCKHSGVYLWLKQLYICIPK